MALVPALLSLSLAGAAPADEEESLFEQLPPPRVLEEESALPLALDPLYLRVSRYAVWELQGVDRRGQFRPRVVSSPYGSYYLYNSQSYPWGPMHPLDVMPFVVR